MELSQNMLLIIDSNSKTVLETFMEFIDYYRIYSIYILNYSNALDKLAKSCISREISLLDLQLDLLKPIQRLPQLKLFFEKISKNNSQAKLVLEKVLNVATYINVKIQERELYWKWVNLESRILGYPGSLSNFYKIKN